MLLPSTSVERELFTLAEVGRVAHKTIAAQLNISERRVYRLRREMIEMPEAGGAIATALRPGACSFGAFSLRLSAASIMEDLLQHIKESQ